MLAAAVRHGWSPARFWLELVASVQACPELVDALAGAELQGPPATVCFQTGPCRPHSGPGRLFTMGSI